MLAFKEQALDLLQGSTNDGSIYGMNNEQFNLLVNLRINEWESLIMWSQE